MIDLLLFNHELDLHETCTVAIPQLTHPVWMMITRLEHQVLFRHRAFEVVASAVPPDFVKLGHTAVARGRILSGRRA
jgi:hypothetical protein